MKSESEVAQSCPTRRPRGSALSLLQISIYLTLAIPLLGIYPEEAISEKDTCTPVFIAALFTVAGTLAWKIPWTEEPGRLQSMGSLLVGHD